MPNSKRLCPVSRTFLCGFLFSYANVFPVLAQAQSLPSSQAIAQSEPNPPRRDPEAKQQRNEEFRLRQQRFQNRLQQNSQRESDRWNRREQERQNNRLQLQQYVDQAKQNREQIFRQNEQRREQQEQFRQRNPVILPPQLP